MHRGARGVGVAVGDRVDDGLVLGQRLAPGRRSLEVVAQLVEQRVVAFVEQLGHRAQQRADVGRLGDRQVEQAIAAHRRQAARDIVGHQRQRLAQCLQLPFVTLAGGQRGEFAFDDLAGADDLERAIGRIDSRRRGGRIDRPHIDARAHAHLDQALDFERDQRLAHRGAGHAELGGQLALGWQAGAQRELAGSDQPAQLVGDLAVQAAGGEGLDRHRSSSGRASGLVNWSGQFQAKCRGSGLRRLPGKRERRTVAAAARRAARQPYQRQPLSRSASAASGTAASTPMPA